MAAALGNPVAIFLTFDSLPALPYNED